MLRWDKLAESRIRKAQAEGAFRDLKGAGKPLPDRTGDAFGDTGTNVGFRMMAEAGALPPEFRWKAEAARLRARLADETDAERRKALMAGLARAEMEQAIAEEARRRFLR